MKVLIGPTPALPMAVGDLKREFPGVEFQTFMEAADMATAISDADAYAGMMTRDLFLAAKRLKWIQSPATGVDFYLVIPELVSSNVRLTSARGTFTNCVAESTMAMILGVTRGIVESVQYQQKHQWGFFEIRGHLVELTDSTFGIIGLGAIGRAIAKRAAAFDTHVVAVDLQPSNKPDYVGELWGMDQLDRLLRSSDYVVVTVPKTPETLGMIGASEIAHMKSSAMLVGVSRGGVIDEPALVQALKERRIASAALDVVDPEPPAENSAIWDLDNLLLCPHIAGSTQFGDQRLLALFRENLKRFTRGEFPLLNEADKRAGF